MKCLAAVLVWGTPVIEVPSTSVAGWGTLLLQITPRSISSLLIQFYLLLQEVLYKDPARRVVHPLMFGMPLLLCKAKKHTAVTLEKALNFMEDNVWPQVQFCKNKSGFGVGLFSSAAAHFVQRLYVYHSWICPFVGERGKETLLA